MILEDIVNTEQRPKIEEIEDDYIYISLKMFDYHKNDERKLLEEQISLVLGKHYVLSFQENENDDFDVLKERINNGK
ncbi:hypothetical protein KKG31_00705 [Patescibacteria group bacterium]|nr:hypothetical protein [Patescibacteria group bacterium]MBU1757705.1 hypothetical protein [Patescibacteria group bacterium]